MSDRDAARRLLRELLPEVLDEALRASAAESGNGHPGANGNGQQPHAGGGDAPPRVPEPPVAAVLRPSTWDRPPAPGELIGDGAGPPARELPAPAAPGLPPGARAPRPQTTPGGGIRAAAGTEWVTLESDADLDRFVRSLLARFENPRDRMAIRAGVLRFALRRAAAADAPDVAIRVERGAVTERTVKDAASAGRRLVLGPGAVLTPLAREKARALGVEIERERRC